jgi:AraC-like DNA-binding protein
VILSLGPPTRLAAMPDPGQPPAAFGALASGLHSRPALIAYGRDLAGIQLDVTPRGARALLGVPAGELARTVVGLDALLGPAAGELLERLQEADEWPARFALIDRALARRLGRVAPAPPALDAAWRLIVGGGGAARVADVAAAVGWSRRQLHARFTREYGVGPKELARIVRFTRAQRLLKRDPGITLAAAAVASGYCDQAHMAREWNELAGCPPSRWLATEELPFVQDGEADAAASSRA